MKLFSASESKGSYQRPAVLKKMNKLHGMIIFFLLIAVRHGRHHDDDVSASFQVVNRLDKKWLGSSIIMANQLELRLFEKT